MTVEPNKLYDAARRIGTISLSGPTMHVRVQGRSRDIALDLLNVNANSPDESIRNSVASFLEIEPASLRNTVLERHTNGSLTLRPQAVFG